MSISVPLTLFVPMIFLFGTVVTTWTTQDVASLQQRRAQHFACIDAVLAGRDGECPEKGFGDAPKASIFMSGPHGRV
jgi:hypothetical protein